MQSRLPASTHQYSEPQEDVDNGKDDRGVPQAPVCQVPVDSEGGTLGRLHHWSDDLETAQHSTEAATEPWDGKRELGVSRWYYTLEALA